MLINENVLHQDWSATLHRAANSRTILVWKQLDRIRNSRTISQLSCLQLLLSPSGG